MARSSVRDDRQLNLPPQEVANYAAELTPRAICSDEPQVLSAQLFDEALKNAKDFRGNPRPWASKEIADRLGISESQVNKWRSPAYRETPSLLQFAALPPEVLFSFHQAMNRRFGFGRQLLARILDDLGAFALAGER
jgi:transcriptional regulator with XRE-family HTH domain